MDHFFKSLYRVCYNIASFKKYFVFFYLKTCGILAPQPGIEPTPPALESEVLTSRLPWNSLACIFGVFLKSKMKEVYYMKTPHFGICKGLTFNQEAKYMN